MAGRGGPVAMAGPRRAVLRIGRWREIEREMAGDGGRWRAVLLTCSVQRGEPISRQIAICLGAVLGVAA